MWEIGTDYNEHNFSIYLLLHYLLADKILSVGRCHEVIIVIYNMCVYTYLFFVAVTGSEVLVSWEWD